MGTIRQRRNGTFELRVVHKLLDKPYYTTHDTRSDAEGYDRNLTQALNLGHLPKELQAQAPEDVSISKVLRDYRQTATIAPSDMPMVRQLERTLTGNVGDITLLWAQRWVLTMKRVEHLAPGTIRKKVECLARVLTWWGKRVHPVDALPPNPLTMLDPGYSVYTDSDGPVKRIDEKRARRLEPGEQERIEAVILGQKRPDRQRPLNITHQAAFRVLFLLIVGTGLRLREAYSLRVSHVRFDQRSIHVANSKTGQARDVPQTRAIYDCLKAYADEHQPTNLFFPFWDGNPEELKRCTLRLSRQFTAVFEYAKCEDLTEHDLRHEAACRWALMKDATGNWMFRETELRKILAHSSSRMLDRYLSLRGSDLSDRLWT